MTSLTDLAGRLKLALVAMSDPRGGDPRRLARRLRPGAWLILRHYDAPDRSVLAQDLARICRARRLVLLIGGDFALAQQLRAGLHLPEALAARAGARIRLWRRRGGRLSVAAHGSGGLRRAAALRATALLSPVFPTQSHPDAQPLGLLAARRLARRAAVPVVALGGVNGRSLLGLRHSAIAGVAAISGL